MAKPAKPVAETPAKGPSAKATVLLEGVIADINATLGTLGTDTERSALVARISEVIATLKGTA